MAKCNPPVHGNLVRITEPLELGEGPHWDESKQKLFFVDMKGGCIHSYDPVTKDHKIAKVGDLDVTLILPVADEPDKFVIGYAGDLMIVTWDGESDSISHMEKYVTCESAPDVRLNDGKTSPSGIIVAGSMSQKLPDQTVPKGKGNVFVIDTRSGKPVPVKLLKNIDLSNGLCWNQEETVFWWADTTRRKVYKFDWDKHNLQICNEHVLLDYAKENLKGNPDGMTIDVHGNLWIACVDGGGELIKVDSDSGEVLTRIEFPNVSDVSSVAFGGKNLEDLYVTTIRRDEEPNSGCLFVLKDLGTSGYPGVPAKIV